MSARKDVRSVVARVLDDVARVFAPPQLMEP
jgi:hypothetical protein